MSPNIDLEAADFPQLLIWELEAYSISRLVIDFYVDVHTAFMRIMYMHWICSVNFSKSDDVVGVHIISE